MGCDCRCGATFGNTERLHQHINEKCHNVRCSCGKLFGSLQRACQHLNDIQSSHPKFSVTKGNDGARAVTVSAKTACRLCKKIFKTENALIQHVEDVHYACPACKQPFSRKAALTEHQKSKKHCFCVEHELAFSSKDKLQAHKSNVQHITGFGCIVCNRSFATAQGLDDHLKEAKHPLRKIPEYVSAAAEKTKAAVDEANLYCAPCKKKFSNPTAFRQHKDSVKHKPLSQLKCPLSAACNSTFTSPSALVLHLESGGCKSGMDRLKLNAVVHAHDTQRHITYQENVVASISAAKSVGSLTSMFDRISMTSNGSESGVMVITPNDSDSDSETSEGSGVLLTPSATVARSRASSSGSGVVLTPSVSVTHSRAPSPSTSGKASTFPPLSSRDRISEWSFIDDNLERTPDATSVTHSSADTLTPNSENRWPCPMCNKAFKERSFLVQHMESSVAHAGKIFHCPTAVLGLHGGGKTKAFRTLSGMAQHIEAGACVGGKGTLDMIVGLFESQIRSATGKGVKLLCDSAETCKTAG